MRFKARSRGAAAGLACAFALIPAAGAAARSEVPLTLRAGKSVTLVRSTSAPEATVRLKLRRRDGRTPASAVLSVSGAAPRRIKVRNPRTVTFHASPRAGRIRAKVRSTRGAVRLVRMSVSPRSQESDAPGPAPRPAPGGNPTADGGARGWRLAWSDEFDGPAGQMATDANWKYERGCGWGDGEQQCYTRGPNNAVLDGHGNLVVTARKEGTLSGGTTFHYTSARLNTTDRFSFTYGRLEARIRVPAGQGLWPAFWAMGRDQFLPDGSSTWPENGEFDVMELLGHDPFTVEAHVHGPTADGAPDGYQYGGGFEQPQDLSAGFHTYGLVWSADAVEWQLDGRPYYRVARADLRAKERWVFDGPFNVLLDLAVGGRWPGDPDASTPFPVSMVVDWVRVSQQG